MALEVSIPDKWNYGWNMTQDTKSDSKDNKDTETSCKKIASSSSLSKEKTASSEGLPTKVR